MIIILIRFFRDGILRVEITTETSDEYDIGKSYEKEERLRQRAASSQIGHYSDDFLTSKSEIMNEFL